MKTLAFLFALVICQVLNAQTTGKILILSNVPGQVLVDGEVIGEAVANMPLIREVGAGDHLVQLAHAANGKAEVKNEMVLVEAGKQKAVSFTIVTEQAMATSAEAISTMKVLVADQNVLVTGILVSSMNGTTNPSEFMYAFEAGDEVVLDITMSNLKGTNVLKVTTYPGGVVLYSNLAFQALTDQRFKIQERGILKFSLTTNHMIDRNAYVKVWRVPANASTAVFNTNVVKKKIYTTHQVCDKQEFFVNSSTNFSGKTRTALPVILPPNTLEWYYRFSASREQADIDNVAQNAGLLSELALGLATAGSSTLLASGAQGLTSILTQPPGANFCDIYLVDQGNYSPFLSKSAFSHYAEGTRENFKSGNVRVACCSTGQYYLGIRNNDSMYGIHVFLDVVAISAVEDWVMEGN